VGGGSERDGREGRKGILTSEDQERERDEGECGRTLLGGGGVEMCVRSRREGLPGSDSRVSDSA
jgi:hypothetical protein